MQVKVSLATAWRSTLLGGLLFGVYALGTAPTRVDARGAARERNVEGSPAAASHSGVLRNRYRDGEQLVTFVRTGEQQSGLSQLRMTAAGAGEPRSWTAWVGRRAVVQLERAPRDTSALTRMLERHRLRAVRPLSEALRLYLVESRLDEDGAAIAARLQAARDLTVVPDSYRHKQRHGIGIPPNDPRYGGQWYLEGLEIEAAWRLSSGARDVTIAIVDDGCDMDHPDLVGQFVGGIDPLDGDDDATFTPNTKGNEHGTACAGIAAAAGDNGVGITGTCPGCTLSCVRLIGGKDRLVPLSADIEAFEYAFATNAAVISNSWGFVEPGPVSAPLAAAIARVANQGFGGLGAVVVFAAGNENRSLGDDEIASLPDVLAVGAVNRFDEAAPFANTGRALDLSAPTGSLTTDIAGPEGAESGDYTTLFGGTSAACPVVAGVAGLMRSAAPQATARQVREALVSTARKAPFATPGADGQDLIYGYGILDPEAALRAIAPTLVPSDAGPSQQDAGGTSVVEAGAGPRDAGEDATTQPQDAASGTLGEAGGAAPADAGVSADAAPMSGARDDGGCSLASTKTSTPWGALFVLFVCLAARRRTSRLHGLLVLLVFLAV